MGSIGKVESSAVSKSYGPVEALRNIELTIEAGEYCCLLGPSGCGKSTTVRMISGHEEVTSGDILLDGRNITDAPPAKRKTALIFQNYALFPHLSCVDTVAFSLRIAGEAMGPRRSKAMEFLELVHMADYAEALPDQLSGGQQQRVALARALITNPPVILLDEPLSALDSFLRVEMRREPKHIQAELDMTFIHVTHSQDEAFALADKLVVLAKGVVQQVGTPREVFETPESPFVAGFIGGHNIFEGHFERRPDGGHILPLEDAENERTFTVIRDAASRILLGDRSDALVLGCAGMTALAARLGRELGLPAVDGVSAAVKLAEALVGLGLGTSKAGGYAYPLHRIPRRESPCLISCCTTPGWLRRNGYMRRPWASRTAASAAGGVTLFADMPLSNVPDTLTAADVRDKIARASRRSVVDFAVWGGFVEDNVAEMGSMTEAGAYGFKMFACDAGTGFPTPKPRTMERGFARAHELGAFIGVHCEDQAAMDRNARACPEGQDAIDRFLAVHAPETELSAVRAVIALAERTGARLHVCHASLPETVDLVSAARRRGVAVSVETCPQYLLCTEDDLRRIRGPLKCTPPVRAREAVEGLWQRLTAGEVDFLCSDHSPAETAEKACASFDDCWCGVNGAQCLFALLHTEAVRRGMDIRSLVRLYSAQPARFIDQYPNRGTLAEGCEADFVIFDPAAEWTIRPEKQLTKHKPPPSPAAAAWAASKRPGCGANGSAPTTPKPSPTGSPAGRAPAGSSLPKTTKENKEWKH